VGAELLVTVAHVFREELFEWDMVRVQAPSVKINDGLHPLVNQVQAQIRADIQVIENLKVRSEIDDLRVFRFFLTFVAGLVFRVVWSRGT